jgi:hypothetical protein
LRIIPGASPGKRGSSAHTDFNARGGGRAGGVINKEQQ